MSRVRERAAFDLVNQLERGQHGVDRMRRRAHGQSAGAEVRVADGLQLFEVVPADDLIERREIPVQDVDELLGRQIGGHVVVGRTNEQRDYGFSRGPRRRWAPQSARTITSCSSNV